MNKWMLSCHSATELMEKKLRAKLSMKEQMGLFFHKAMCDACRRYENQSRYLEQLFLSREQAGSDAATEEQAHELEEKILRQLEEEKK